MHIKSNIGIILCGRGDNEVVKLEWVGPDRCNKIVVAYSPMQLIVVAYSPMQLIVVAYSPMQLIVVAYSPMQLIVS